MRTNLSIAILALLAFPLAGIKSCNCNPCLEVPTSDTTPPTLGMMIEYKDSEMNTQTISLSSADPTTTITANGESTITILYGAQDPEGIKSMGPSVEIHSFMQVQHPSYLATSTDCPRKSLLNTLKYEDMKGKTIHIYIGAENWVGLTAQTAEHIIKVK